jgi:hypothetical protein
VASDRLTAARLGQVSSCSARADSRKLPAGSYAGPGTGNPSPAWPSSGLRGRATCGLDGMAIGDSHPQQARFTPAAQAATGFATQRVGTQRSVSSFPPTSHAATSAAKRRRS